MPLHAGAGQAPLELPDWPQTTDGTPLHARVLVLDNGTTRLAVVSLSIICLIKAHADQIRRAVAEVAGVPVSHVLCACTHVHSGPPTFAGPPEVRERLLGYLVRAATEAAREAAKTQPAALGQATDHLPGVSRVRRILRRDGSAITLRRAWPQWWGWATDPETVGPEEPLDDLLTVLRVDAADGQPLAALFHFTCHPIPDFFGYAARLVEAARGVPCLMLNGCSGSVDTPFEVPMRGQTQEGQLPILGEVLGHRVLELFERTETSPAVTLGADSQPVFLPVVQAFLDDPQEKALVWPDVVRDRGFHTEVQCLRLGDLALVGIPGEPHVGFGQVVADLRPGLLTRVVGLANDEVGYLFPPSARARGGYEPDPVYWGVVADEGLAALAEGAKEAMGRV